MSSNQKNKLNNIEANNNAPNKRSRANKKGLDNLSFSNKFQIVISFAIIFILLFLIMYRNSKISESFSEIKSIKNEISKVEKENNQLEVSIQSSLNLYNVEQSAKELLGMQKLTNAQTIYISLPKKDYIETSVEDVVIEDDGVWGFIKNKIEDLF